MKKAGFNLIFVAMIITNIIFIIINISSYQYTNEQVLEKIKTSNYLDVKEIAQEMEIDIESLNKVGETIALASNNLEYNRESYIKTKEYLDKTLKSIVKNNYQIETAYTFFRPDMQIEKEMPYICVMRNNKDPATFIENKLEDFQYWNEGWYILGKNAESFSWTEPYFEQVSGRKLISGVKKMVNSNGEFIGVSGIDISIDNINKLLSNVPKDNGTKAYLISAKGNYIYHPNSEFILKKNIKDDELSFLQDKMGDSKYGIVKDNNKYYFFYKLEHNSWHIILEQPADLIEGSMRYAIVRSFILMVLGNILIIGMLIVVLKYKKAEKKIKSIAYYNSCTSLPNMNYINKNLPECISKIIQQNKLAAVMSLNMDNFKAINDNYGHEMGDEFLRIVAQKFKGILEGNDKVFHTGGDEFIFFIDSVKDKWEINIVAQKILNIFYEDINISGNIINYVTASIGISIINEHGTNLKNVLNCADDAMHYAKNKGKNRYEYYTSEMHSRVLEDINFEKQLIKALINNEFNIFYQPKFDGKTGKLLGMEALIRWIKSDGTIIYPDKFIIFAEKKSVIIPIGERVLRLACIQNKVWQNKGYMKIPIAVNLSAAQLLDEDLIDKIDIILKETDLEPQYLELEITESMIMKNFDKSIKTLKDLSNLGINICLDDFGTGYSSLNYLRNLPINKVKIDKSFVNDIVKDEKTKIIAISIIKLLHSMNLKVVAEGVEYKEQLDILTEHNCDEFQGFFFSKPIPSDKMENIIKNDT